ncbi:hypothetical protein Bpfe_026615 [Biomphalaria pfeifferi]|uniref:Uncharacterized protein n=1 Tax=Biomphalaria pfeifferi TaxID=112525 RepID=A0AAD8EXU0_BIOPF|nr:hypothetical protein Bpfe_026615 [Biomphalaria pfeifferi]
MPNRAFSLVTKIKKTRDFRRPKRRGIARFCPRQNISSDFVCPNEISDIRGDNKWTGCVCSGGIRQEKPLQHRAHPLPEKEPRALE